MKRVLGALPASRLPIISVLLLGTALIYWPSAQVLAGLWSDTENRTYTHGYLILAATLWLIFADRKGFESAPVAAERRALVPLLLVSGAWLVFWRAGLQDLHLFLLPIIALGAALATLGWAVARRLVFPIALLYFALPLWGQVNGILQGLTVKAMSALIWATGLPALISGNLVQVPAGTFEIAEGCSGLHFFIVGLATAALQGRLLAHPLTLRLIGLALMGTLAIVANWARVFTIIVAGYATDMRSFLVTVDHYWFGWGVFVVAVAVFIWISGRLERTRLGKSISGPEPEAQAVAGDGSSLASVAAAMVCMSILPLVAYLADSGRQRLPSTVSIALPEARGGWGGSQSAEPSGWTPEFHGATADFRSTYTNATGTSVEAFGAAYLTQRQGVELVAYNNSALGETGTYRVIDEQVVRVAGEPWVETRLDDGNGSVALVWTQYRIGTSIFARPHLSQIWYGLTALFSSPVSSVFAIRTTCHDGCERARAELQAFATAMPRPSVTAGAVQT